MKYEFMTNTVPMVGQYMDDGKKIKDPVKITISIELERSKFESLNHKYTDGLAGRIMKLFK